MSSNPLVVYFAPYEVQPPASQRAAMAAAAARLPAYFNIDTGFLELSVPSMIDPQ